MYILGRDGRPDGVRERARRDVVDDDAAWLKLVHVAAPAVVCYPNDREARVLDEQLAERDAEPCPVGWSDADDGDVGDSPVDDGAELFAGGDFREYFDAGVPCERLADDVAEERGHGCENDADGRHACSGLSGADMMGRSLAARINHRDGDWEQLAV